MATRKALGSTIMTPGSRHTKTAQGNLAMHGGASRSKHTAKAVAPTRKGGSKGGGTSSVTSGMLGQATRRYERRNDTYRPMAR